MRQSLALAPQRHNLVRHSHEILSSLQRVVGALNLRGNTVLETLQVFFRFGKLRFALPNSRTSLTEIKDIVIEPNSNRADVGNDKRHSVLPGIAGVGRNVGNEG